MIGMSLLDLFRKRAGSDGGITERLILDGVSLTGTGNGGSVRPSDQLQALERYGNFGRREKIAVTMLFVGKALRELDGNGCYRDVSVVYAESREQLPALLRSTLKAANRSATVVVTGAAELAQVAEALGATVMRDTTLRKAIDRLQGGDRGPGNTRLPRNRGGSGSGGGNTGRNKPAVRNSPASRNESPPNGRKNEVTPPPPSGGIDDLIDLV